MTGQAAKDSETVNRGRVLAIAWPIILSNLSTPLLGLVDTAVIGNLGDPALIGAIAVGGMVFSFLYWGFGFLRMGTTGLIAQARGAGDTERLVATLYQSLLLGAGIGLLLLLCQAPLAALAFRLVEGSEAVEAAAGTYFSIRIWAAPLSLSYLAILGYLLGQQRPKDLLWLQLLLNGTNILLDVVFVVWWGWGVAGVAWATVLAEVLAILVGGAMVFRHLRQGAGPLRVSRAKLLDRAAIATLFSVNRDIMIRTLCLVFALAWFTNEGAKSGDLLLAANAILMQFVTFSAFFLDGFALAGETLVGSAVGSKNRRLLLTTLRYITELGIATSLLVAGILLAAGPWTIDLLTNADEVRQVTRLYLIWAVAAPLTSLWCYLLDGVFIGATGTPEMRNAMIASLAAFLASEALLGALLANHGLWLSLHIFYVIRALSLLVYLPRVLAKTDLPRQAP